MVRQGTIFSTLNPKDAYLKWETIVKPWTCIYDLKGLQLCQKNLLSSCVSYSMASVCGGYLALEDAGVPVKCPIAGIAMGLVLDTQEFGGDGSPLILSDITGSEDASGDMDFKAVYYP